MINKFTELIKTHFSEAQEKYTGLSLSLKKKSASIVGPLSFEAAYDDVCIEDTYDIEIMLTEDYPDILPKACETGGIIPADFHKFKNGNLCLGAPPEIRKQFERRPDIVGFIEYLLIPYLYTYSHKLKYHYLPYGELQHNDPELFESCREILDTYKIKFDVGTDEEAMKLLKILAEDNYRGHMACPCGRPSNLRRCHGSVLLELRRQKSKSYFFVEYFNLLPFLFPEVKDTPKELISKRLVADFKKS